MANINGNGNGKSHDFSNYEEYLQHKRRAGVSVIAKPKASPQKNSNDEDVKEIKDSLKAVIKNTENKTKSKTSVPYSEETKRHYKRLGRVKPVYSNKLHRLWSGFCNWAGCAEKKPWDLMALLVVPIVLAGTTVGFNYLAKHTEMELAGEKERQLALTNYIEKIPENLYTAEPNSSLLQAKTRTTLQLLEGDIRRREALITFLKESSLLNKLDTAPDKLKKSELYGTLFKSINLKGIDLSEADLREVNLTEAQLYRANLRTAKLNSANLSYAGLSGADLRSKDIDWIHQLDQFWKSKLFGEELITKYRNLDQVTTLIRVNLQGAYLNEAKLDGAILQLANLRDAEFGKDVELSGTDLRGANLIGANLREVKLAELKKANLENVIYYKGKTKFPPGFSPTDRMIEIEPGMSFPPPHLEGNTIAETDQLFLDVLRNTDLSETNLTGAILIGVNLTGSDLTKATLAQVTLDKATLKDAIFTDVDLSSVKGLTKSQLSEAKLCRTKIPNYIKGLDGNKNCSEVNNLQK